MLRWTQVFFSTTDNDDEPIENTVENGKNFITFDY